MLLPGGYRPKDDSEDRNLPGKRYPEGEEQISLETERMQVSPFRFASSNLFELSGRIELLSDFSKLFTNLLNLPPPQIHLSVPISTVFLVEFAIAVGQGLGKRSLTDRIARSEDRRLLSHTLTRLHHNQYPSCMGLKMRPGCVAQQD